MTTGYELTSPDRHTFVRVTAQTGCRRCGYAAGHHPKTVLSRYRVTVYTGEGTAPTMTYVLTRWPLMRLVADILKKKAEGAKRIDVDDTTPGVNDGVMWVACDYKGVNA